MKKALNFLLSIATLIVFAIHVFYSLNYDYNFVNIPTIYNDILTNISIYGPVISMGLFMFINVIGKGFIRVFFTILAILVMAGYVLTTFFPDVIGNIFPI